DMVCYFADSEPGSVAGQLDDEMADYGPRYAGDGGRDPATDHDRTAMVRYASGVRALVNASKGTVGNFEFDLVGERGRLRIGTHVAELWRLDEDGRASLTAPPRPPPTRASLLARGRAPV